jgi:hypothetical protein
MAETEAEAPALGRKPPETARPTNTAPTADSALQGGALIRPAYPFVHILLHDIYI